MTDSAENPSAGSDRPPLRPRSHGRAIAACITACVVFIAAIALLYWTWLPRQNPNALIVVQASEEYVGAEVTIEAIDGASPPVTAILSAQDNYRLRIHVAPGMYRVTIRQHGRVLAMDERVEAVFMEPHFISLHPSATRPTVKRLQ